MGEITLVGNGPERHLAGPKTSIMRKFITPLLLLCAHFAIGQKQALTTNQQEQNFLNSEKCQGTGCGWCQAILPWTWISDDETNKRLTRYAVKAGECSMDPKFKVRYNIGGMDEMLGRVMAKRKKRYDGVRAYFVTFPSKGALDSGAALVPPGEYLKPALIFVPTTKDPRGSHWHQDDINNIMVIYRDGVKKVTYAIASMWIHTARSGYLACLLQNGQDAMGKSYVETHSLWYSRKLGIGGIFGNGLYHIVHCRNCCKDHSYVDAWFAAFLEGTPYDYQLSLVFKFGDDDANGAVTMSFLDFNRSTINELRKSETSLLTNGGGSDTGKPCPPPPNCDSTGSSFPSNTANGHPF